MFVTRTVDTPPKWASGLSVMLLHLNVPDVGPEDLNERQLEDVMCHLSARMRGHPLVSFSERAIDARVAADLDGDYAEALVQTQISCEILLDGVLTLLAWEEGTTPQAAARWFDEALPKRIRTYYSSRLGGDWNPTTSPPLAAWKSKIAYVRGRVVHAGYRPTLDQALDARAAADGVEDFVKERVAAKRTRYPRTALMTLGRPGLERRGLWTGQIKRFAEAADEEPDWLTSYNNWREQFDQARV